MAGTHDLDMVAMRIWYKNASKQRMQMSLMFENDTTVDYCTKTGKVNMVIMGFNSMSISKLEKYLNCKRRPVCRVLIIKSEGDGRSISSDLDSMAKSLNHLRCFYAIEGSTLHHLFTFRNQAVLANHQYDCIGNTCKKLFKEYNLQGAKLIGSTLPWDPWLTMEQCETSGQSCRVSGILADLMNIIGNKYNFTLELSKADHWGLLPTSGCWNDPNATFSGVWGAIANDEQDLPLTIWAFNHERNFWADTPVPLYDRPILIAINNQVEALDLTLLFRPFTPSSWLGAMIITIVSICCIILPRSIIYTWKDNWASHRIFVMSGWLLFILLNAFYGGALTMFFTHAPNFPFNNMREGIALWPNWKMVAISGNEYMIEALLSQIPEARSYLNFFGTKEGKKELLAKDYKAALQILRKPGYFLFESEEMALGKAIR